MRSYPFTGRELVYCDPPYVLSTITKPRYRYVLSDAQHMELLDIITSLPCLVMISGYWTAMYAEALQGWTALSYQAKTRRGMATEWVWMNYGEPMRLHDYSHLGANFRERERVKRKQARWVKRLRSMPRLERLAMVSACDEVCSDALAGNNDAAASPAMTRVTGSSEITILPGNIAGSGEGRSTLAVSDEG